MLIVMTLMEASHVPVERDAQGMELLVQVRWSLSNCIHTLMLSIHSIHPIIQTLMSAVRVLVTVM